jgi:outer membrane protein OmpA-like peptidoglycan-associated protein
MPRIFLALAALYFCICAASAEPGRILDLRAPVLDLRAPVIELNDGAATISAPGVTVNETEQEIRLQLAADILFDFDKAVIRTSARPALEKVAVILRQHVGSEVRFEGHTDSKGADAYNQKLSLRRAKAVESWFAGANALDGDTVSIEGFAARRPVADNIKPDGSDNPEGRQSNRRVEIIVRK